MDWDLYEKRLLINGATRRERIINQTRDQIIRQSAGSPALKTVLVNGVEMQVFITSTKEASRKNFNTLPGEKINMGALIVWNEMHWLVISVDFDDEITCSGTIVQCNRIIRWQNTQTLEIIERWCLATKPYTSNIEDGKYISMSNREYKIQLPYDEETSKVDLGKRFMLEKIDGRPRTYQVTSVDSITNRYEDIAGGFLIWNLTQDSAGQPNDNVDLGVCDYIAPPLPGNTTPALLQCEISGGKYLPCGDSRRWDATFYLEDGITPADSVSAKWDILLPNEMENEFYVETDRNSISVRTNSKEELFGCKFKICLTDDNSLYAQSTLEVEVTI